MSNAFAYHITPLSTAYQKQLIAKKLWQPSCPVTLDRLRDVQVSYYDFSGKIHHDGHIIVLDAVAKPTAKIFSALFAQQFPIASIKPTSDYQGDDDASMTANNSSSFNCREITGGGLPSLHGFGVAIDINPIQNPYVKPAPTPDLDPIVLPENGKDYVQRQPEQIGMVEPLVPIFYQQGFLVWGGKWQTLQDYQHFQPTRLIANYLAAMKPSDAATFFALTAEYPHAALHLNENDFANTIEQYQTDPQFMKKFRTYLAEHETRIST